MPERTHSTVFALDSFANSGDFAGRCFRYNGSTYDNYSTDASTIFGTQKELWADTNDIMYWGQDSAAWKYLGFYLHTAGSYGSLTWEYWNGSTWASFTPAYEGTAGFSQNGYVMLGTLASWASTTVNSQAAFWVRASVASVTTAAQMYNFLLNVFIDAPHVLMPGEYAEGYVRDVNGTVRKRDIAVTHALKLAVDCRARCLTMRDVNLLRYLRDARERLYLHDWAQTATPNPTIDSFYSAYNVLYCTLVDPQVAAAGKMRPDSYTLEFDIDTATGILS